MYNKVVTGNELKRWLLRLGAKFEPGKGSHFKVSLNGKTATVPIHGKKEMKTGTIEGIKKALGIR